MRQPACLVFIILAAVVLSCGAVKFDLTAVSPANAANGRRCLSQIVAKDTLVMAKVNVGQGYNQRVGMEILDDGEVPATYATKNDLSGEYRNTFNTKSDGIISVCFTNILTDDLKESPEYRRTIEIDLNVGAEAVDMNKIAKEEKLTPLETELRKLETVVNEILSEMNYLKRREARMRDTNESTNERVKWFSLLSLFTLVTLGIWQILYLRRFFRRKRLID